MGSSARINNRRPSASASRLGRSEVARVSADMALRMISSAHSVRWSSELATASLGTQMSYWRMWASAAVNSTQISAATPVRITRLAFSCGSSTGKLVA